MKVYVQLTPTVPLYTNILRTAHPSITNYLLDPHLQYYELRRNVYILYKHSCLVIVNKTSLASTNTELWRNFRPILTAIKERNFALYVPVVSSYVIYPLYIHPFMSIYSSNLA